MERKILRSQPMADDLDISLRSLYTLVDAGCPCIKIRKLLWFDRAKVLAWLEKFERIERPEKKQTPKARRKFQEAAP
jgi:hypothetical protein